MTYQSNLETNQIKEDYITVVTTKESNEPVTSAFVLHDLKYYSVQLCPFSISHIIKT